MAAQPLPRRNPLSALPPSLLAIQDFQTLQQLGPMQMCKRVVIHPPPAHEDEVLAVWLMHKFGNRVFPGNQYAEVILRSLSNRTELFEGKTWEEHWLEGTVLLGFDGPFNEHPTMGAERLAGECCASLMAKMLGVADEPAVADIVRSVTIKDVTGYASEVRTDLPWFKKAFYINEKYRRAGFPPKYNVETLIYAAVQALDIMYESQLEWHAANHEPAMPLLDEVQTPVGTIKVISIASDNWQMTNFMRKECGADIIICRINTGNTVVMGPNPRRIAKEVGGVSLKVRDDADWMNERFDAIVESIRSQEACYTGARYSGAVDGNAEGDRQWYYARPQNALLNGDEAYPTHISLEQIHQIVVRNLGG